MNRNYSNEFLVFMFNVVECSKRKIQLEQGQNYVPLARRRTAYKASRNGTAQS